MNYFIFNYQQDVHLVDSFLESASLAHLQTKKSKEWFFWKFRDNPFGETILACAEENGKIAGCVAYGLQNFRINNLVIKCGLSFETFVHPEFQGKGLFKILIYNAEEEAKKRNIQLLLNFPNSNSLSGFLKMGWNKIDVAQYWIRGKSIFTIFSKIKEIRKTFNPSISNFERIKEELPNEFKQNDSNKLFSEIDIKYIQWRFFTFPNAEYIIINDDDYFSIARIGYRGTIKEAQVLFANKKKIGDFKLLKLLKAFQLKSNYDIISFSNSKNNNIKIHLKRNLFLSVPNKINFCYKYLDNNLVGILNVKEISLNAINYHTY